MLHFYFTDASTKRHSSWTVRNSRRTKPYWSCKTRVQKTGTSEHAFDHDDDASSPECSKDRSLKPASPSAPVFFAIPSPVRTPFLLLYRFLAAANWVKAFLCCCGHSVSSEIDSSVCGRSSRWRRRRRRRHRRRHLFVVSLLLQCRHAESRFVGGGAEKLVFSGVLLTECVVPERASRKSR